MSWNREVAILSLLLIICIILFFTKQEAQSYIYIEQSNYENNLNWTNQLLIKNDYLKLQLLEDKSYTKIASKAASEGFIPEVLITP